MSSVNIGIILPKIYMLFRSSSMHSKSWKNASKGFVDDVKMFFAFCVGYSKNHKKFM